MLLLIRGIIMSRLNRLRKVWVVKRDHEIAGKDYIYMVILLNKEGQKRKLLFNVSQRDECITELRNRVK